MATSLLSHLANRISQKEDLATTALVFVLNRSAKAREALELTIERITRQRYSIDRLDSQFAAGDESRPDVALRRQSGQLEGFIEAKFWAGLTDAQPTEYIKRLKEADASLLIFLAPKGRLHGLKAELLERCRRADLECDNVTDLTFDCAGVRVGLCSWSELLDRLELAVAGDSEASADLYQLRGLCDRFETEGFVPLDESEMGNLAVPRRMKGLVNLVYDSVGAAEEKGLVSTDKLRGSQGKYRIGRYAKFGDAGGWVGLSFAAWVKYGRSALWLYFDDNGFGQARKLRPAFEPWIASVPPRAYLDEQTGALRIPLLLPSSVARDAVMKALVDQYRAVHELVDASFKKE